MGKISQGILGSVSNKVGNVVGRVRYGENILAIYQPKVANPRTTEQRFQRAKFTGALKFAQVVKMAMSNYFKKAKKGQTNFNAGMSYNLRNAIRASLDTHGDYVYNTRWADTMITDGDIENVYNPQVIIEEGAVQAMWTDNSGIGNAESNDQVVLVAVLDDSPTATEGNPDSAVMSNGDPRNARTTSLALPSTWQNKYVQVYIFAHRSNEGSPSYYAGRMQVAE